MSVTKATDAIPSPRSCLHFVWLEQQTKEPVKLLLCPSEWVKRLKSTFSSHYSFLCKIQIQWVCKFSASAMSFALNLPPLPANMGRKGSNWQLIQISCWWSGHVLVGFLVSLDPDNHSKSFFLAPGTSLVSEEIEIWLHIQFFSSTWSKLAIWGNCPPFLIQKRPSTLIPQDRDMWIYQLGWKRNKSRAVLIAAEVFLPVTWAWRYWNGHWPTWSFLLGLALQDVVDITFEAALSRLAPSHFSQLQLHDKHLQFLKFDLHYCLQWHHHHHPSSADAKRLWHLFGNASLSVCLACLPHVCVTLPSFDNSCQRSAAPHSHLVLTLVRGTATPIRLYNHHHYELLLHQPDTWMHLITGKMMNFKCKAEQVGTHTHRQMDESLLVWVWQHWFLQLSHVATPIRVAMLYFTPWLLLPCSWALWLAQNNMRQMCFDFQNRINSSPYWSTHPSSLKRWF